MAGPFYVDIGSPAAWNGRTGLDHTGNEWLGLSGLQKACDTVATNEIVYIKGTSTTFLYSVAYDADNDTTLTDGEEVTWGVDATHGHGVVHITSTTATSPGTVEIELISGTEPANDLDITGVTSGGLITPTATIAKKGITVDTNAGALATGYISYIGVNASWANDGTRAIVDMNAAVDHGFTITKGYTIFENLEAQEAGTAKNGFNNSGGANVFINCSSHNNALAGFYLGIAAGAYILCYRCVAYSNTGNGFTCRNSSNLFVGCASYSNTADGFGEYGATYLYCIAHANRDGWPTGVCALHCVADANTSDGFVAQTVPQYYFFNRITNHTGGIGFNASSNTHVAGFNYFENNSGDNMQNTTLMKAITIEGGTTNSNKNPTADDDTDTGYGYTNAAGHDFSTKYTDATDPQLRRTAITIPWT